MLLIAAVSISAISSTARADEASFVQAFANVCTQFVSSGLGGSMEAFVGHGWQVTAGADLGEFEAFKDGTNVFVATSATGGQPGCTVMDETVSRSVARKLLTRTLELNFANAVKGTGYNNTEVWRVARSDGTLVFSVDTDLSGSGAALLFELRP